MEKDLGLRVSHETIRNVLEEHKYSSRVATKKLLLSAQNVEKRFRFATEHVSLPPEYSDRDAIFSDQTKIRLYYRDGRLRVWRKPLAFLENKNFMVVYTLEQRWEILRQNDLQNMPIWQKKNHLFR